MPIATKEHLTQLDEHLASSNQAWLFGAGISVGAGIPLMHPLTARVLSLATADADPTVRNVIDSTRALLPADSHIEHILSHFADHVTIADRAIAKEITFGAVTVHVDVLRAIHAKILNWIAETIRWGYRPAGGTDPETVGVRGTPIVDVNRHTKFVEALFNRTQAGIADRRSAVRLFTTNYDTLLEDALALASFPCWDGFTGGAVAYRNFHYGDREPKTGFRAHLIKLHGSIDWHLGDDDRVCRVRDGDCYPARHRPVLIYPQATKYLATQRDPFAAQFDLFRRCLASDSGNVLAICGYSFGDEHVNQELDLALQRSDSKTTIIAFSRTCVPKLQEWLQGPWGQRVYVLAEDGLYVGDRPRQYEPAVGATRDWWTFEGVTQLLSSGAEASVR